MMVVDGYDTQEVDNTINELNEKITTLEKTNEELNNKLNQRDAELKICYANIVLLIIVILLIVAFKIVKNIRKAN